MLSSGFARFWFTAPMVLWTALQGGRVSTQEVQPVNSGANPYRTIRNWGMLPEGRPWGAANGVAIDRDGKSLVRRSARARGSLLHARCCSADCCAASRILPAPPE